MASSSERIDPNVDIVQRWLGMELFTFTRRIAEELGIQPVEGVYVARVYPGTPADRASIAEGTIIMQVNDEPISSIQEITEFARQQGQSSNRVVLIVQEPNGSIARKVVRP
jgi:serine protease Do